MYSQNDDMCQYNNYIHEKILEVVSCMNVEVFV